MAATNPIPEFDREMDDQPSTELAVSRDVARVVQEVQGAIIVAQRFPRNEDEARIKILRACKRPGFAEEAEYEFPRGGNDVSGPSVQLAREAARVWGNIQYGFEIVSEDTVWRSIRAYAWDVESNSKTFQEDRFKKLIQRKNKTTRQTEWITPDERDLRELTNRRAAICYRNCILQLIPKDLVDEACIQARVTLKDRAASDPDGERKRILDAFANDLNIMPNSIEALLQHPIGEASPAEIARLRAIYKSIRDGNSTLNDYFQSVNGADANAASKSTSNLDRIKDNYAKKNPQPSSESGQPAASGLPHPSTAPENAETTYAPSQSPEPEIVPAAQERRKELANQAEEVSHRRTGRRGEPQGVPVDFSDGK